MTGQLSGYENTRLTLALLIGRSATFHSSSSLSLSYVRVISLLPTGSMLYFVFSRSDCHRTIIGGIHWIIMDDVAILLLALKLDISTLFTTFFLWIHFQFILSFTTLLLVPCSGLKNRPVLAFYVVIYNLYKDRVLYALWIS